MTRNNTRRAAAVRLLTAWLLSLTAAVACATGIENDYFSVTMPDDSWAVSDDAGALRQVGARAMLSRSDAAGAAIDLARIDYLTLAFTPASYLTTQIVERRDIFARDASTMGEVADTVWLGQPAVRVHFTKQVHGYTYLCTALTANAGLSTMLVITARREGTPPVINRVVSGVQLKVDATPLTTTAVIVAALQPVLKTHSLPVNSNDALRAVELLPDGTLLQTVTIPYVTQDVVDVPRFVQVKRDEWVKSHAAGQLLTLLEATAMAERRDLRYSYVDDRGNEIGSLLIMAEEY